MVSAETVDAFAVVTAGIMLLIGMMTGTWKFVEMRRSPDAKAPMYVDIAHRASLLYAAALGVCALLTHLSPLPPIVELAAVGTNFLFFIIAVAAYIQHGLLRTPHTQYRQRTFTTGIGTWLLAVAELAATSVLLYGAFRGFSETLL